MSISTYTQHMYGFTKPYIDNLKNMDNTLGKTQTYKVNEINNTYNKEINKLNQLKQNTLNNGNLKSEVALNQPQQIKNNDSTINRTVGQNTFKGLGGKLSETMNTSLLNTAQNVATQSLNTTSSILQSIDEDMAKAKATRDVALAESTKQKFDLIYDNFYKNNEMYLSNRELIKKIEE